jgi:hypothetical protein
LFPFRFNICNQTRTARFGSYKMRDFTANG